GTNGARDPFWSPDGAFIAFFADSKLKRIATAGGPARDICAIPNGWWGPGRWNPQGLILFSAVQGSPLYRVAATGGAPIPATSTEATGGGKHDYPDFLPDGRHFLFTAKGKLFLGSVDSKDARVL